jgi:hypothetical protein
MVLCPWLELILVDPWFAHPHERGDTSVPENRPKAPCLQLLVLPVECLLQLREMRFSSPGRHVDFRLATSGLSTRRAQMIANRKGSLVGCPFCLQNDAALTLRFNELEILFLVLEIEVLQPLFLHSYFLARVSKKGRSWPL